jgi:hypothetical protein
VWLTECLLSAANATENTFPFGCELTIDDLHRAYCSWMEIKKRTDIMYKSVVHFHKGLKSVVLQPSIVPDDVNAGTSFILNWYQMEAGILKTRLGLDPTEPDNLENSPFRRVLLFKQIIF